MSHVSRVLPPGFSRNFSKSYSLNKGKAQNFLKSQSFYREGRFGIDLFRVFSLGDALKLELVTPPLLLGGLGTTPSPSTNKHM